MEREGALSEHSKAFATRIVKLYAYLRDKKGETVMSKQILRSGTSIGANVAEAKFAASKADFVNRLRIALKEANETSYWLDLLLSTGYVDKSPYDSISADCKSIIYLLIRIIRTTEANSTPHNS